MDQTEKLTQRVPHNFLQQRTRPTLRLCISVPGTRSTREQRQNDGLTSPSQRTTNQTFTALRPSSADEGLDHESRIAREQFVKELAESRVAAIRLTL
jgi:hypothetical protein